MSTSSAETVLTRVPPEIWLEILDWVSYSAQIFEPSLPRHAHPRWAYPHPWKKLIFQHVSVVKNLRLVCASWKYHLDKRHHWNNLEDSSAVWVLTHPKGTSVNRWGKLGDIQSLIDASQAGSVVTMALDLWDKAPLVWPSNAFYEELSKFVHLQFLTFHFLIANPWPPLFESPTLSDWLERPRVTLPKLTFLHASINQPCILPLNLPSLVEFSLEDSGQGELLSVPTFSSILERFGQRLAKMNLKSTGCMTLPQDFGSLVPKLVFLQCDLLKTSFSAIGFELPPQLRTVLHIGSVDFEDLWTQEIVLLLIRWRTEGGSLQIFELSDCWEAIKPVWNHGIYGGSGVWRGVQNRQAQLFAQAGIRLQDSEGKLWEQSLWPSVIVPDSVNLEIWRHDKFEAS